MRAMKLDFVPKMSMQYRWGIVFLIVAMVVAVCLGQRYVESIHELETWKATFQDVQKKQHKRSIASDSTQSLKREELQELQTELKLANRVIDRLAMPWDGLFRAVETTMTEQVSLLGMDPDVEKNTLRITAEAKNLAAMLDYQKRLNSMPLFKDVHVVNHQMQAQDPQKPVRFMIDAEWLEKELRQPVSAEQKTAQSVQDQTGQ